MEFDKTIVNARYFREIVATEIQANYTLARDFRGGLTGRKIDEKYNIAETLGYIPGKQIDTAILMAIGGFTDINGDWHEGEIPQEEYKIIATSNIVHKGKSGSERRNLGIKANNAKFKKNGLQIWTDEEKYLVWQYMHNGPKDNRGRVKRKLLVEELNENFENDRKDSHVRNMVTQYRNITKPIEDLSNEFQTKKKNMPWSSEEKYLVWQYMHNGPKYGARIERKKLIQLLNTEFHKGREVRTRDSVINRIKKYKEIRNHK